MVSIKRTNVPAVIRHQSLKSLWRIVLCKKVHLAATALARPIACFDFWCSSSDVVFGPFPDMRLAVLRNECLARDIGCVDTRSRFLSTEHPVQFAVGLSSLLSRRLSGCWGGFPRRLSFWNRLARCLSLWNGLASCLRSGGGFYGSWYCCCSELWHSGNWSAVEPTSYCGRQRRVELR
jgi:hypothetical protein